MWSVSVKNWQKSGWTGRLHEEPKGNFQYFRCMCSEMSVVGLNQTKLPPRLSSGPSFCPTCHMLFSACIWKSHVWRTLFAFPWTRLTLEPRPGHKFPARAENGAWSRPELPQPLSVSAALLARRWVPPPPHSSSVAQVLSKELEHVVQ